MENKWEEFAKNFETSNNYVVGIKDINRVKQKLKKHPSVGEMLEIGCGNGTYTECFVKQARKIIATDISQPMIEVSKLRFEHEPKVLVEQADCFALPYEDNRFDTVFMANLLHVIPNPVNALQECFRVLKPNGRIIGISFTLHNMSCFNKLRLKFRFVRKYGFSNPNSTVMTPVLAHELAATAGFQEVSTEMLGKRVKAVHITAVKSLDP